MDFVCADFVCLLRNLQTSVQPGGHGLFPDYGPEPRYKPPGAPGIRPPDEAHPPAEPVHWHMNIGQLEHLVKRFQQGDVSATELGALSVADLDLINAYLAGCRRVYSEFGFTHPQGAVLDPLPPGAGRVYTEREILSEFRPYGPR